MNEAKRKQIVQAIKAKFEPLPSVRAVKIGTFEPNNEDKPCVGIIPDTDDPDRASKLHHKNTLRLRARCVVDSTHQTAGEELEDVLKEVSDAMNEDRTWGGLALDTIEKTTSWLYLDEQWPQAGADIEFEITFQ